jgi:hypothetical protein
MKQKQRHSFFQSIRWAIASIAVVGAVTLIIGVSKSFQECVQKANNETGEQPIKKRIGEFLVPVTIRWNCTGEFLHNNGEAITATFTVVLAISTIGLWLATNRLWKAGERQLDMIAQSITAAKTSAEAATDQVGLSRLALISVERAFVFLREIEIYPATDKSMISFLPRWENSGQTPARNLQNMANWYYFVPDMPDNFDFSDQCDKVPSWITIGPKATIFMSFLEIDRERIDGVIDGKGKLYIWGWAEYDDVFPESRPHRTEFCLQVIMKGVPGEDCGVSIRFQLHRNHNATDDECPLERWKTRSPRSNKSANRST